MNDCEIPEEEQGLFEAALARRSKQDLNTGRSNGLQGQRGSEGLRHHPPGTLRTQLNKKRRIVYFLHCCLGILKFLCKQGHYSEVNIFRDIYIYREQEEGKDGAVARKKRFCLSEENLEQFKSSQTLFQ